MAYKVLIGNGNKWHGLEKDTFEEGEVVKFYVVTCTDTSYSVRAEGVRITCDDYSVGGQSWYSFMMPAWDVQVEIDSENTMTFNPNAKPVVMGSMAELLSKHGLGGPLCEGGLDASASGSDTNDTNSGETRKAPKFCPECGAATEENFKFCRVCGYKLV